MGGTQADVLYWSGGAGDRNWATAGNWAIHSGSPTTTVPSDGEGVLFDERAATGVDGSDQSATELSSFLVSNGFGFNIGSDATPLSIDVDHTNGGAATPRFNYAGRGAYCKVSGSITNLNVHDTGSGAFYISGGTTTTATIQAGRLVVDSGAVCTNLNVIGGQADAPYNATAFTTLYVVDGLCNTYRSAATAVVGGSPAARLRALSAAAFSTRLDVVGGTVEYLSSGTIAALNVYAGLFDPRANRRGGFTITNHSVWWTRQTNFIDEAPGVIITKTNAGTMYGQDLRGLN